MRRLGYVAFVAVGLAVCGVLVLVVGPRASSEPDGLERVAIDRGFAGEASPHALEDLPTADYAVEGIDDEGLSTGVAGVIGVAVTFVVGGGLVAVLRRRRGPVPAAPG